MGGVELEVSVRQSECYPGDVVEGNVRLTVKASDNGTAASALVLTVVGLAKTRVMSQTTGVVPTVSGAAPYTHRSVSNEDLEVLGYDLQLASFGGKVQSGEHNFPFSVTMPSELPPSMKETGNGGSMAVAYGFRARLQRPGLLNFDSKGKVQLRILSKPRETDASQPVLVGPDSRTVKRCYCMGSGSMSVGFQADRSVVGLNEPVGVTVVARNDSSTAVRSVLVELVQETKFWAQGDHDCSTRIIETVEVPIAELAPAEVGGRRGQSPSAVADAARADLEHQLASGAGSKVEIVVPCDASLTFRSMNIEVRHLLTVRLKTPSCVDSPDVWMPLRIQPGARPLPSTGAAPGAPSEPFAPSFDAAASLVNVNRVSVPQSAVRLDYSYELPEKSGPAKRNN
eukprot:g9120.t1